MSLETLLTKDQLKEILNTINTVYVKPNNVSSQPPTIMPPFKKLGVLVDYDEITGSTDEKPEKTKLSQVNNITQSQTYSCVQCRRRLPTAHLLDLHIVEQHDLYFEASVERGNKPMYACYIEECVLKFQDSRERKEHCIAVHKFPANYRFDQEKVSKAVSRKKAGDDSMDVDKATPSNDITFPYVKAFSFGHHTRRTFNTRKENMNGPAKSPLLDVKEMKEALNLME